MDIPECFTSKAPVGATRFLVLGGGVAALSAAEALRRQDANALVLMVGAESELPYSRPMLTKAPLRGFDALPFQIHPPQWFAQNGINIITGQEVAKLNHTGRIVTLANGQMLHYDTCIYALGAESFVPPVPGREKLGVFSIRTLGDISAMRRELLHAKSAVLIGGGVIGLEAAFELQKAGCALTVLELAPTLMGRLLDEESARLLERQITRQGMVVRTGIQVESLMGGEHVAGVRLSDSSEYSADVVIFSCGIRACSTLAAAAGAAVGRGVVVDAQMQTTLPGLYACGDCAEFNGTNLGLWQQAAEQGRVAGTNAAGGQASYAGVASSVLMHGKGICLYAEGDTGKDPSASYQTARFDTPGDGVPGFMVNNPAQNAVVYEKYFFKNGTLCGGILMGSLRKMALLHSGIESSMERAAFLQSSCHGLKKGGA